MISRRTFATAHFALRNARRAQINSVARIAIPPAMTRAPGPGKTSIATPIKRTVPPMSAMKTFFTPHAPSWSPGARIGATRRPTFVAGEPSEFAALSFLVPTT